MKGPGAIRGVKAEVGQDLGTGCEETGVRGGSGKGSKRFKRCGVSRRSLTQQQCNHGPHFLQKTYISERIV